MIESLHCTNCGAPLNLKAGQTLAACAYCNSTLRVAFGAAAQDRPAQPSVTRMAEVPPAVVDEVKRLLVLGNAPKAIAYYAKETGLTEAEAGVAVRSLQETVGYAPALNWIGVALLALYTVLGTAAAAAGLAQITMGRLMVGVVLIVLGAGWVALNWLVLGRGIRAMVLTSRGTPAEAVILKRWTIKSIKARGETQPVELVRFLLSVQPPARAPYEAEANAFVREQSRPHFQPDCRVRVRFDAASPRKLVLIGPVE